MRSTMSIRQGGAIAVTFAGLMAASPLTGAETGVLAEFTATTANMSPGSGETVKIDVLRWSKDEERNELISLVEKGDTQLFDGLKAKPSVGYIWTSGSVGYPLRYAYRVPLPDGGERVIVVTDLQLGVWDRNNVWKASGQSAPASYPFTLIELRLNRRGIGDGKLSLASKVTVDRESKTLALENYAAAPVLLKGVTRARSAERSAS